jgi:aspartate carbamoyltransferase catalytic subunit
MRHLLDTTDLTLSEIDDMIELAMDIINSPDKYAHICSGKKTRYVVF